MEEKVSWDKWRRNVIDFEAVPVCMIKTKKNNEKKTENSTEPFLRDFLVQRQLCRNWGHPGKKFLIKCLKICETTCFCADSLLWFVTAK